VPGPLSVDLRTRIVNACAARELSQAEIAKLFQVHIKTVEKLWKQWRTTQSVAIRLQTTSGDASKHSSPRLLPKDRNCRKRTDERAVR
jgi:transposase